MELITVLAASRRVPSHRSRSKHVDVNVVRRWVKSGKLKRYRVAGVLHVDAADVAAIVAARSRVTEVTRKSADRWQSTLINKALRELLEGKKS